MQGVYGVLLNATRCTNESVAIAIATSNDTARSRVLADATHIHTAAHTPIATQQLHQIRVAASTEAMKRRILTHLP